MRIFSLSPQPLIVLNKGCVFQLFILLKENCLSENLRNYLILRLEGLDGVFVFDSNVKDCTKNANSRPKTRRLEPKHSTEALRLITDQNMGSLCRTIINVSCDKALAVKESMRLVKKKVKMLSIDL